MNQNTESSSKKDVYALVTEQVITQLEKGVIPWRRPWVDGGIPQNLISKRPYRGINLWLLSMYGYTQNYFLTYKQVQELGGKVKRGETGHMVIFWKMADTQTEDLPEEEEQTKKHAILRYYLVFNISQCENIPEDKLPKVVEQNYQPLLECEMIIQGMPHPPVFQNKESEAYYHPGKDYINMPKRKSFSSNEAYYAVLFHELIHSTGYKSRLNRIGVQQMTPFGSDVYSTEEIIAEMGSCYLCSIAGIAPKPLDNSVAYIQGWLEKLKNDKKILIYAACQAQKAADSILITSGEAANNAELATDETVVSA